MRFVLLALVLLPSLAFARSVNIEVDDVLTFESIKEYSDGTKAVTLPKIYDYFLGVSTRGIADDNAEVVCRHLDMRMMAREARLLRSSVRTINFVIGEQGRISRPWFEGDVMIMSKVLCRPWRDVD